MTGKWKVDVAVGAVWGFISIFLLLEAMPPHNLIMWLFGSPLAIVFIPAGLAFLINSLFNLVFSLDSFPLFVFIFVFTLSTIFGALIGAGIGYLVDKYRRRR